MTTRIQFFSGSNVGQGNYSYLGLYLNLVCMVVSGI
jgi:hypothetical protein